MAVRIRLIGTKTEINNVLSYLKRQFDLDPDQLHKFYPQRGSKLQFAVYLEAETYDIIRIKINDKPY